MDLRNNECTSWYAEDTFFVCQGDLHSHVGRLKVQHPDGTAAAAAQHLVEVSNRQGLYLFSRYLQRQHGCNEVRIDSIGSKLACNAAS